MITLSNGHAFQFMVASGALAFDGKGWPWEWPLRWAGLIKPELFTVVGKSLTLKPKKGNLRWINPLGTVRLLKNGTLNAIGLTNPGIDWWIKNIYPEIEKSKTPFVCSIAGESLQENMEMAIRLKVCTALKALEINASCPNSSSELRENREAVIDLAKVIKKEVHLPLILKLSCTHDYVEIATLLEGVIEAVSINSIPWNTIFPTKKSPLSHLGGGGVSGKVAQGLNWKMVQELSERTKIPVIGPSVWEYMDIDKLFDLGAGAVSFGSIFLRYPWRPTQFVEKWLQASSKPL